MVTPELAAVVTALVAVAGLYYRHLLQLLAQERAEKEYWRDQAMSSAGLAELATDEAERATRRKR